MNDPRGSIWRKWDLHVHTRKDANYTCLSTNSLSRDNLVKLIDATSLTKAQITSQEKQINSEQYAKLLLNYINLFTGLSVIAITNHNSGDELDEIIDYSQNFDQITIFPGAEVTSCQGIHMVCLFNPVNKWMGTWKDTIEHFLTEIGVPSGRFNNGNPLSASCSSQEILEKTAERGGICIFAHIQTENGLFKQSPTASGGTAHIDIYTHKLCNIVQLPSNAILSVGVGNIIDGKEPSYDNKAVTKIKCSDARKLTDIGTYFTWIKADPTFEGLKQIIYEPEVRVRIQGKNPEQDHRKPFFFQIDIGQGAIFEKDKPQFSNNKISLNKDLVAIIGGRGTGKSLLLDALKKTFDKAPANKDSPRFTRINDSLDFKTAYFKEEGPPSLYILPGDNNLDYLHVQQGEVKDIVEDAQRLDEEVKKLIGIGKLKTEAAIEDRVTQTIIQAIINDEEWLGQIDNAGNRIYDISFQKQQRKKYEDLITTITTKENETLIEQYRRNSILLDYLNYRSSDLDALIEELNSHENDFNIRIEKINNLFVLDIPVSEVQDIVDKNPSIFSLEKRFIHVGEVDVLFIKKEIPETLKWELLSVLGDYLGEEIEDVFWKSKHLNKTITPVDYKKQKAEILAIKTDITKSIKAIEVENNTIRQKFIEQKITEDVSTLLRKVDQYQASIDEINSTMKIIENRKKSLADNYLALFNIATKFRGHWDERRQEIEQKWEELKNSGDTEPSPQRDLINKLLVDIEIAAYVHFDQLSFYKSIEECVDMKKFRSREDVSSEERMKNAFGVKDVETFLRLISNENIIDLEEDSKISLSQFLSRYDYFVVGGEAKLLNILFLKENVEKYIQVLSKSTYQDKEPSELSVGQRGTFYVCLKLATDTFGSPFVFDQPEDDLDNDFIMKKLVPIFREIKKYRQVIIVTHNANLCVNADAEQVIVASNEGEVISYTSGSLENHNIRKSVYNILEGGKEAFLKREQKYAFSGRKI
jgi:hypothetical protein